jgi:hypothetical protein
VPVSEVWQIALTAERSFTGREDVQDPGPAAACSLREYQRQLESDPVAGEFDPRLGHFRRWFARLSHRSFSR